MSPDLTRSWGSYPVLVVGDHVAASKDATGNYARKFLAGMTGRIVNTDPESWLVTVLWDSSGDRQRVHVAFLVKLP